MPAADASARDLEVSILVPTQEVFRSPARMVVVPGISGDFGVLRRHATLVSGLRTGLVVVHLADGGCKRFFVSAGFAEVARAEGERTECCLLVESARDISTMDLSQEKEAMEHARIRFEEAENAEERKQMEKQLFLSRKRIAALLRAQSQPD